MKAAVYRGKEQILVETQPIPAIAEGEVLIKVEACTVCGVDLRTYRHGDAKIAPPRILGHEFSGIVAESNAPDAGLKPGDRVCMYIVLACGVCRYCQAGRANLCTSRTTMAYHHDGAFAEYIRIPAAAVRQRQLYKVPEHVPLAHAALAEPLGCVLNAHSRLALSFSDTVAVIGAGPIGIMHALVAKARGARQVMILESSPSRLELAKRFGFDEYILVKDKAHLEAVAKATDGIGPSAVIVAVGVAQAQADALEMAGRGARVEFFGGLPKSKPEALLNTNHLHYKELMVSGSYSEKRSDYEAAQAMIFTGRLPAKDLITHDLPLERINEAFGLMESGDGLKIAIKP